MKFITIGQYFYRLYNSLLLVLLVPIFAFIIVYLEPSDNLPAAQVRPTIYEMAVFIAMNWMAVFFFYLKKIKSIRNGQGLGLKLEKYFFLTIVRFSWMAGASMLLAFGFYLTKDDWVTGLFVMNLVLLGALWPTSPKVCRDLKLRGDEREMVYYKKDSF
jgi:hypothetical protein